MFLVKINLIARDMGRSDLGDLYAVSSRNWIVENANKSTRTLPNIKKTCERKTLHYWIVEFLSEGSFGQKIGHPTEIIFFDGI